MPLVISQAVEAPISFIGLVWMLLLAYLIFTMTLVLQRKRAAYGLALGLATLCLPLAPLLLLSPAGVVGAGDRPARVRRDPLVTAPTEQPRLVRRALTPTNRRLDDRQRTETIHETTTVMRPTHGGDA